MMMTILSICGYALVVVGVLIMVLAFLAPSVEEIQPWKVGVFGCLLLALGSIILYCIPVGVLS